MSTVPTYALYGESTQDHLGEPWHCESIPSRSRLHHWEIRPHRHAHFLQILYLSQGSGSALLGTTTQGLQAPAVLCVPAGLPHGFRFAPDVDGFIITVVQHLLPPELRPLASLTLCSPLAETALGQALHQAVANLASEFNSTDPWRAAAIHAALMQTLVLLARQSPAASPPAPASRAEQHYARYQAAVDQHFRQAQQVAFYSQQLGMTPTQLNRICRQVGQCSALEVLHQRLLAEARRDLVYTQLSIKQIALTLGFADAAYFSRFFRLKTGLTPGAYRSAAHERLQEHAPRVV